MNCPKCSQPLRIASSKFDSAEGSTDVFRVLSFVCTNSKCELFGGKDLANPSKVAKVEKRKVN
jgi:hypothetical protein